MRISDWSSDVCSSDLGTDFAIVNLGQVQKLVDAKKLDPKKTVDHGALKAAGVARGGKDGVRLLAKGELTAKLNFAVAGAAKGAIGAELGRAWCRESVSRSVYISVWHVPLKNTNHKKEI